MPAVDGAIKFQRGGGDITGAIVVRRLAGSRMRTGLTFLASFLRTALFRIHAPLAALLDDARVFMGASVLQKRQFSLFARQTFQFRLATPSRKYTGTVIRETAEVMLASTPSPVLQARRTSGYSR